MMRQMKWRSICFRPGLLKYLALCTESPSGNNPYGLDGSLHLPFSFLSVPVKTRKSAKQAAQQGLVDVADISWSGHRGRV
jgi:hypothetical protein